MALINCRECEREISDQAPACPNCGAPALRPRLMDVSLNVFDVPRGWMPLKILFRPDDNSEFHEVGSVAGSKNRGEDSWQSTLEFGESVATVAIVKEHKGRVDVIEVPIAFEENKTIFCIGGAAGYVSMNRLGAFMLQQNFYIPSGPRRTIGVITPLPSFGDD